MGILFNNYANVGEYKKFKRDKNYKDKKLNANRLTLLRAAITVGLTPKAHLNLSRELLEWKISTMLTFVDTKSNYKIQNVEDLEMSERISVAYFIGMVFANIQMQKEYNVRHLMHISSPGNTVVLKPGVKKSPDLWGINYKTKKSYLVEAKGSLVCSEYFARRNYKRINDAKEQLEAVLQIEYKVDNNTEIYNDSKGNLNKLIIATHPNEAKEMLQHVIDPSKGEEGVITLEGNEVIYNYYYHLVKFIKFSNSKVIELPQMPNFKFRVFKLETFNYSIGLLENIYEVIEPFIEASLENNNNSVYKDDLQGMDFSVNHSLDEMESISNNNMDTEVTSLGPDGIIVMYDFNV